MPTDTAFPYAVISLLGKVYRRWKWHCHAAEGSSNLPHGYTHQHQNQPTRLEHLLIPRAGDWDSGPQGSSAFRLLSHSRGHTIVLLPGCLELIWVLSGESVEEAIRREVAEEVGLEVENLQYSTSQHWPFPNSSLMIACHATAKPGQTEVNSELSLTLWCPLHRPLSALWACV